MEDLINAQCAGLPEEVCVEIKNEVTQQMDAKTELIIRNVTRDAGAEPTADYTQLVNPQNAAALEAAYQSGNAAGMGEAIAALPELAAELQPLVELLHSYAASRLQ